MLFLLVSQISHYKFTGNKINLFQITSMLRLVQMRQCEQVSGVRIHSVLLFFIWTTTEILAENMGQFNIYINVDSKYLIF